VAKGADVARSWWVVDGEGAIVGRLAAEIAMVLMGKHRPTYTPHVDTGDFVIVTNADKVVLTGKKWDQKVYTRYTGYPGLRVETARSVRERAPDRVLREAVRRMLPKNKLATRMLGKLKIYCGPEHPHQAQKPQPLATGKRIRAEK
jgi:large subunit ribosomal protein L13